MQKKILWMFSFLLPFVCAFSEELEDIFSSSPIASLSSHNDFLVGGAINPFSGMPSLRQTDLVAKGAQEIPFTRIFISQFAPLTDKGKLSKNSYGGWVHFPYVRMNICTIFKNNKIVERRACVVDSNGMVLVYALEDGKTSLESKSWGICNGVSDSPSGKYDPRNVKIRLEKNMAIVQSPDGTERHYNVSCEDDLILEKKSYNCSLYLLQKEILPNGKVLEFYYEDRVLKTVVSTDSQERHTYATLNVNASPFNPNAAISTNTGLTATYKYKINGESNKNLNLLFPLSLTKAQTPFYRHETSEYYTNSFRHGEKKEYTGLQTYNGQNLVFKSNFGEFVDRQKRKSEQSSNQRVSSLALPNENDVLETAYKFIYNYFSPGVAPGETIVTNHDGTKTIFCINSKLLPTNIRHFDAEGLLKKEKIFEWYENQWLKSIEIQDTGKRLSKKTFEYDSFGNPILEKFEGDLSGNGLNEVYTIKRQFSKDGRNLLLQEDFEEGKTVAYTYRPNTNLIETKTIKDKGTVVSTEARSYDDCCNLKSVVENDGGSIKTTVYTLRNAQPFLHMPEWIEEFFQENGQHVLLKRSHLHYDKHGNVSREDIYDSHNKLRYTINKEYNERGDLISETNALGQKATYTYEEHGWLQQSINFSGKLEKTIDYDLKGRPKVITEKGTDGVEHQLTFGYDHNDCITCKTDSFNHETNYVYDPISQKPIQTQSPFIFTQTGITPVITNASYDVLGRKTLHRDANGNVTSYKYNAYGSPTEIIYADQSKEFFKYTKNGLLACHTDPDGRTIKYSYDGLGRVKSKSYEFNGQHIAQESFNYEGSRLISSTDKQGYVTTYAYDGAGRKKSQNVAGRATTYTYDALGRVEIICQENGLASL